MAHESIINSVLKGATKPTVLSALATPNKQGLLPLHIAAREGKSKTVAKILEAADNDVNARDASGRTVLMIAAEHDRLAVVRKLLKRPDVEVGERNEAGENSLHLAAMVKLIKR